jgi:hypothetical protein
MRRLCYLVLPQCRANPLLSHAVPVVCVPCCFCWAAGVAAYLSPKVSGFLMKKELDYLGGWVPVRVLFCMWEKACGGGASMAGRLGGGC